LRQSAQKIDPSPSWKQEVNRRVAEHKGRKPAEPGQDARTQAQHPAGSRAARAAARVAARYAQAPSYSEMLADEARAAVRAAEAASRAALQAQAAAESVLAGLEAASSTLDLEFPDAPDITPDPTPQWNAPVEPERSPAPVLRAATQPVEKLPPAFRLDEDTPAHEDAPAAVQSARIDGDFGPPAQSRWDSTEESHSPLHTDGYELVEPARPIHANLIEFPRELVATRKLRPRRAEGPYAASMEAQGQLSIFEVEPWTISTEPEATGAASEADSANWAGPKWSGIELDEEPREEIAAPAPAPARVERSKPSAADAALLLAPMNRRVMAAVIDFSLIAGSFVAAAFLAASKVTALPSIQALEKGSAVSLALIALFYLTVFFTLASVTPGMKYANLEIRTFSGEKPTRAQRCGRLAALLVSLLPVGLGVMWSLFDDQHLCWHDRLSGTYPRRK
jgi:uncharacterized RDD family membrane protein YckC